MTTTISEQIFTVTELSKQIKHLLETKFFSVQLKGEITNLKEQSSGHLYFSLKDENSQISAVLFKGTAERLSRLPKSGDKVIIRGELSLYMPRGTYQIIVREFSLDGIGDLLLKLHELKEKLKNKGYFDQANKKALPLYPKTIGIVTSPTGAVIQDIIQVLTRRSKHVHLILNPVKVQGEGAAKEIADAIQDFNSHKLVDVIIVGRGGGSLEDLWAFNEECVADAIFHSNIPVISAVGHETDFSIADFVADLRAPTPSAAAEIVVKESLSQIQSLAKSQNQLKSVAYQKLKELHLKLSAIQKHPQWCSAEDVLATYQQKMDESLFSMKGISERLLQIKRLKLSHLEKQLKTFSYERVLANHAAQQKNFFKQFHFSSANLIKAKKEKLQHIQERLGRTIELFLKEKKSHLSQTSDLILTGSPDLVLKKGYCIPFHENTGSVIMSSNQLKISDTLRLRFYSAEVKATVTNIQPLNKDKAV